MDAGDREALRSRLFLRGLLPLLGTVVEATPSLRARFARVRAVVQVEADAPEDAARLVFEPGRAPAVVPGAAPGPSLRLAFRDRAALNAFFAGRGGLPRIRGAWRSPLLTLRVLGLLSSLRVLAPDATLRTPVERELRVRLTLELAARALSQLTLAGHPAALALAASSPERVYQWTVLESGAGAWLRMERGRVRAGTGAYARRAPFVHYIFPTVEGALRVFTNEASQMEGVQRGDVRTEGSPEYSRKLGTLLQDVDALLTGG